MGASATPDQMAREAGAPPLPEGFEFASAAENPLAAAAAIAEAGADGGTIEDIPLPDEPGDDTVKLAGGLVDPDNGEVYRSITVRELNGEDEEFLARAFASNDFIRYQQAMLERGVTHVGPHKATPELLDRMLIGDRDTAILGIRMATYGETIDLDVMCQHCGTDSKIRLDLKNEVPIRPMTFPVTSMPQQVELPRSGALASIRLANGADQRFVYGLENKTVAELNTELLARCVHDINGAPIEGRKAPIQALGMGDRSMLVGWLRDEQPGPEYEKVNHSCVVCGKETPLGLTTGDLFRG